MTRDDALRALVAEMRARGPQNSDDPEVWVAHQVADKLETLLDAPQAEGVSVIPAEHLVAPGQRQTMVPDVAYVVVNLTPHPARNGDDVLMEVEHTHEAALQEVAHYDETFPDDIGAHAVVEYYSAAHVAAQVAEASQRIPVDQATMDALKHAVAELSRINSQNQDGLQSESPRRLFALIARCYVPEAPDAR